MTKLRFGITNAYTTAKKGRTAPVSQEPSGKTAKRMYCPHAEDSAAGYELLLPSKLEKVG
jgi:hypothetical protein